MKIEEFFHTWCGLKYVSFRKLVSIMNWELKYFEFFWSKDIWNWPSETDYDFFSSMLAVVSKELQARNQNNDASNLFHLMMARNQRQHWRRFRIVMLTIQIDTYDCTLFRIENGNDEIDTGRIYDCENPSSPTLTRTASTTTTFSDAGPHVLDPCFSTDQQCLCAAFRPLVLWLVVV